MKDIRICNISSLFQVFHLEIPVSQIRWPYKIYYQELLSKPFIVNLILDEIFIIVLPEYFDIYIIHVKIIWASSEGFHLV